MSGSVFNGKSIMQLACLDFTTSHRLKKKRFTYLSMRMCVCPHDFIYIM